MRGCTSEFSAHCCLGHVWVAQSHTHRSSKNISFCRGRYQGLRRPFLDRFPSAVAVVLDFHRPADLPRFGSGLEHKPRLQTTRQSFLFGQSCGPHSVHDKIGAKVPMPLNTIHVATSKWLIQLALLGKVAFAILSDKDLTLGNYSLKIPDCQSKLDA